MGWGDYPGLSGCTQYKYKGSCKRKKRWESSKNEVWCQKQMSERFKDSVPPPPPPRLASKMEEEGAVGQRMQVVSGSWKRQGKLEKAEFQKELRLVLFYPIKTHFGILTSKTKIILCILSHLFVLICYSNNRKLLIC